MKDKIIDFFSNMISVVLGIVITFAVQGKIDRIHESKEVASALDLVRTELLANIDDINVMSDYLRQEKKAADFFLDNRFSLKKCPEDSISYNGNLLFADAAISVSSDALELLKSSSLFQKIGDKDLSMKIIRAYDTCGAIASSMNRHLEDRNNRFDKAINNETAKQLITGSNINIRKFISSPYGAYSIQWVANQPDPSQYVDISDINAAIEAINSHTH